MNGQDLNVLVEIVFYVVLICYELWTCFIYECNIVKFDILHLPIHCTEMQHVKLYELHERNVSSRFIHCTYSFQPFTPSKHFIS